MLPDLKYAIRMLAKSPGFSAIAIITLALGIGANSAIFSVVDAVLLRPLPFPNADRLVAIWGQVKHEGGENQTDSYPNYADFRDQSKTLHSLTAFTRAGAAMVLAAIGIYGVIAYSVAQRTKEIGIRMALGAQRADRLRMILRQSLTIVGIGLAIGLVSALVVTRLMATLLYGVGSTDLFTYASVLLLLAFAALLASFIPARRAMNVDPMVVLRYE